MEFWLFLAPEGSLHGLALGATRRLLEAKLRMNP